MEQTMTVDEVLMDAIRTIESMSIPVSMHDTVGSNLARVSRNLQTVRDLMIQRAMEAQQQAQQTPENPTETPDGNTDGETTEGGGGNE